AGEVIDRALHIERLQVEAPGQFERLRPLRSPVEKRAGGELRQVERWQRDVLAHTARHDQPLAPAVRRQVEEAAVEHLPRRHASHARAGKYYAAGGAFLQPEASARHSRLARADESRQTDNLAGVDMERNIGHAAIAGR